MAYIVAGHDQAAHLLVVIADSLLHGGQIHAALQLVTFLGVV